MTTNDNGRLDSLERRRATPFLVGGVLVVVDNGRIRWEGPEREPPARENQREIMNEPRDANRRTVPETRRTVTISDRGMIA